MQCHPLATSLSSRVAVVVGQVLAKFGQVEVLVNAAQEVILGNVVFKVERIEQPVLPACPLPHHDDLFSINQ